MGLVCASTEDSAVNAKTVVDLVFVSTGNSAAHVSTVYLKTKL